MIWKRYVVICVFALFLTVGVIDIAVGYHDTDLEVIDAPSNFEISKVGNDVVLEWSSYDDVCGYMVYRTDDVYSEFPDHWNSEFVEGNSYAHEGALVTGDSYFYMIRQVIDDREGELSPVAYCIAREFVDDADNKLHYISIPSRFNNIEDLMASDIVEDIEGHTGQGANERITSVVKWDYTIRSYNEQYNYSESISRWDDTDDFSISPGDGIGIYVQEDAEFTWHICGMDMEYSMEFVDDEQNLHYISIPYTMFDVNQDGELTASDIVRQIEGHTGIGSNTNIEVVVKWNYIIGGYDKQYDYRPFPGEWGGDDFSISPGDTIGLILSDGAEFTWTPSLTKLQPPSVIDIIPESSILPLETNITFTFSNEMNRTTVEDAIYWPEMLFQLGWSDNMTLNLQPKEPLSPGEVYNITIFDTARDMKRNLLDGNLDGLPGGDFVYSFSAELPPVIKHQGHEAMHMDDEIIIQANVTDDIELEYVELIYGYDDVSGNISMTNIENDTFTAKISPLGVETIFNYTIRATDTSGLVTISENYSFPVLNLTPPVIVSTWQEHEVMLIDGILQFEFSKYMDTDVDEAVTVEPEADHDIFWIDSRFLNVQFFGLDEDTEYTVTLDGTVLTDEYGVPMGVNHTQTFTTQSQPEIELLDMADEIFKGSDIEVKIQISSILDIKEVMLYYNDTMGDKHPVIANYSEGYWTAIIPKQNRTGEVRYYFTAEDVSGSKATSTGSAFLVTNPSCIYPCYEFEPERGTTSDFSIRITNPVGVREAILHYNGESIELTLTDGTPTDGNWSTSLTIDDNHLEYQVEIIDWDGESIVLPDVPISMEVGEQQTTAFGNHLWLIILAAMVCAGGVGILWKKRSKEIIPEDNKEVAQEKSEEEQFNNTPCTVCFGNIDNTPYQCSCGNIYHENCIHELGECPICGKDPFGGVQDEET